MIHQPSLVLELDGIEALRCLGCQQVWPCDTVKGNDNG